MGKVTAWMHHSQASTCKTLHDIFSEISNRKLLHDLCHFYNQQMLSLVWFNPTK